MVRTRGHIHGGRDHDRQRSDRAGHGRQQGIGVDLAECFAKDGYDLILTARTEAALKEVADAARADLRREGNADRRSTSASPAAVPRSRARSAAQGLTVDVLVNNAGYGIAGAFDGSDRASQLGMIDLNVRALVELTHIYWHGMLDEQARRRAERRVHRGVPARAADGDLLRVEGLRALVLAKRCGRKPKARACM